MTDEELKQFGDKLDRYCKKYNITIEHLFEILNDQKVIPMIRGKPTEFNAYEILKRLLNPDAWSGSKTKS